MQKVMAAALGVAAGAFALSLAMRGARAGRVEDEGERERRSLPPERPPLPRERPPPERDDEAPYLEDMAAPYGPYHGKRRPSGLPLLVVEASGSAGRVMVDGIDETAALAQARQAYGTRFSMSPSLVRVHRIRRASVRGGALLPIAEQAARQGHGQAFVDVITHLAKTEGEGGTFAVAARNFNAGCLTRGLEPQRLCTPVDAPRNEDRSLITAWGVFQWNRGAGRDLKALDKLGLRAPYVPSDWMPWDWTAAEEIAIPINYYAQLWALVRKHGGTVLDAARGVRLWHTGPSRFRAYLLAGANPAAWLKVNKNVASIIDRHLKKAGVA